MHRHAVFAWMYIVQSINKVTSVLVPLLHLADLCPSFTTFATVTMPAAIRNFYQSSPVSASHAPTEDESIHAPSPYPPSSPADSDSDSEPTSGPSTVHTFISTVPESRLRALMIKLAETSRDFQRVIKKELTSPTATSPRRTHYKRRPRRSTVTVTKAWKCANCGQRFNRQNNNTQMRHEECTFHPGHLEEEVFEFVSRSPEGRSSKVIRPVIMWSCCGEDDQSMGCVIAPVHLYRADPDAINAE